MQRKTRQTQSNYPVPRKNRIAETDERSEIANHFHALQGNSQQAGASHHLSEQESIVHILVNIQQQQWEQLRLLNQLVHEVEALKELQTQQDSTVNKLDRQLRRARLWRISWQLLRWTLIAAVVGAIIYVIGLEQILAIWARIIWLLT